MPKVKGPLFSVQAMGDLAKVLTFQNRPGGATVYPYSKPGSRVKAHAIPTAEQELIRGYYQEAVATWQYLTSTERALWDSYVKQRFRIQGHALKFDGIDDKVKTAITPTAQIAGAFTFEVRLKPGTVAEGVMSIGGFTADDVLAGFGLNINQYTGGKMQGWIRGVDDAWHGSPGTDAGLATDKFSYLAITYDLENLKEYADGAFLDQVAETHAIKVDANQLFRLGESEMGENDFLGIIDEVRISDIARIQAEITANWYGGAGRRFLLDAHTVALWHMDEGSGDKIYDETDNDNDGTIYGASWVDGLIDKLTGIVASTPPYVNVSPETYDGYRCFISQYVRSKISG